LTPDPIVNSSAVSRSGHAISSQGQEVLMSRILVVGGGYAGCLAALRAAPHADVTLVDARAAFVDRIRLHERAAGGGVDDVPYDRLLRGVRVIRGRVAGLGDDVALEDGTRLGYDRLIVALGSTTDRDRVPGAREHALDPGDTDGAVAIAARLPAVATVAVVGGGHTGLEVATEIAAVWPKIRVSLYDAGAIGVDLSPAGVTHLRKRLQELQIAVHEGSRVDAVEPGALVVAGERVPVDLVAWCASFRASPLVSGLGPVDPLGRVRVDGRLHPPGRPAVQVVGDCAAVRVRGNVLRMTCATAMPMGAYAGDTAVAELSGRDVAPLRFAWAARCLSLGAGDGLAQLTDRDDAPGIAITGWPGARIKSFIARYPRRSLYLQRLGWDYRWPTARDPARLEVHA
jgi:NADH dehydrogenase